MSSLIFHCRAEETEHILMNRIQATPGAPMVPVFSVDDKALDSCFTNGTVAAGWPAGSSQAQQSWPEG